MFDNFNLESHPSCSNDYVMLSEQILNYQHGIAKICGTHLNKIYRTSGSKMFVKFTSDTSKSFKGFNASYKTGRYCL